MLQHRPATALRLSKPSERSLYHRWRTDTLCFLLIFSDIPLSCSNIERRANGNMGKSHVHLSDGLSAALYIARWSSSSALLQASGQLSVPRRKIKIMSPCSARPSFQNHGGPGPCLCCFSPLAKTGLACGTSASCRRDIRGLLCPWFLPCMVGYFVPSCCFEISGSWRARRASGAEGTPPRSAGVLDAGVDVFFSKRFSWSPRFARSCGKIGEAYIRSFGILEPKGRGFTFRVLLWVLLHLGGIGLVYSSLRDCLVRTRN